MLAYAFRTLNEKGYQSLGTEEFSNTAELCSAILALGISKQIKRGMHRDYIPETQPLSVPRGKINIADSIKTQSNRKRQLICTSDDFSTNTYMNRIIKTTAEQLLRSNISDSRKKALCRLMPFFEEVKPLDLHSVKWNFRYDRNNQSYRMLIFVCYLVLNGLLQRQGDGTTRMMDFLDEQRMCQLYEKFILEYYRRELPADIIVSSPQIPWDISEGADDMLPAMRSDAVLAYCGRKLVIDAKYYSRTTQLNYGKHSIHSHNLYQIFSYVKNLDKAHTGKVSGLLLYAKTDEPIHLDTHLYQIGGNQFEVRTLDLNCDFSEIKAQLNRIVADYFQSEQ